MAEFDPKAQSSFRGPPNPSEGVTPQASAQTAPSMPPRPTAFAPGEELKGNYIIGNTQMTVTFDPKEK